MSIEKLRKLSGLLTEATTKKKLKSGAEGLAQDAIHNLYDQAKEGGWDDSNLDREEEALFWQYCYKHLAKLAREQAKK